MVNEELTDDYVASLLAEDAKESSIRYSAMGLEGFAPPRPPSNKPKPNTRFLRNIIKDIDNHNAALLAKEAADARARLRTLSGHQGDSKTAVGAGDIRKRQLGDIAAILGGRAKKRTRIEDSRRDSRSRPGHASSDEERSREKSRANRPRNRDERDGDDDTERSRDHKTSHRRHRSDSEDRDKHRSERRKRDRSRSRSPREHTEKDRDSRRRHRSPRRRRSPSSADDRTRSRHDKFSRRRRRSTSREARVEKSARRSTKDPEPKPDYDSDPLDDIIGPRPPVIEIRGRGARSEFSGIDSRFSANYDPTADVQLDPEEENDWDQAMEALRDRQKWEQQRPDRLRAAGFTEDEVSKWQKGGAKREEDVKWAKKGEGREWDRGKVLDDDGGVKLESSFGRLTN